MKVGDLVRLMLDGRIGIVTDTNLRYSDYIEVLFHNNRRTQVQPYYLNVINESR